MRLDKFLAHLKFGSRKEVKKYIRKGYIEVNGEICFDDDYKLDLDHDIVKVNGEVVTYQQYYYLMLNKPKEYISSNIDELYPSVLNLIEEFYVEDLRIVGRLDVDTTGLLLLTNDGQLAHRLLSPKHHVDKVYNVELKEAITEKMVQTLQSPIEFEDITYQPGKVKIIDDYHILLTIKEGKFHQVKNMIKIANNEVVNLKRLQMGPLKLDENLAEGEYREINAGELQKLKEV